MVSNLVLLLPYVSFSFPVQRYEVMAGPTKAGPCGETSETFQTFAYLLFSPTSSAITASSISPCNL